jgi:hypothetical protein
MRLMTGDDSDAAENFASHAVLDSGESKASLVYQQ